MDIFLLKLILSFIVGSIWIVLVTVISEKYGTKIGGAIGGIPSTIVIALFFIGWTQTPIIASQSTTIIPISLGLYALFILIYILLSGLNLLISIFLSLIIWLCLSSILIFVEFNNFLYSVIGFVLLSAVCFYIAETKLNIKSKIKKKIKYKFSNLLFRGIFSGAIITFAVLMAKIGGPIFGGIFASFPATAISIIVITRINHGIDFSNALIKAIMFSATINCFVYAVAVRYLYLYCGLFLGTFLSFFICLISTYYIYNLTNNNKIN